MPYKLVCLARKKHLQVYSMKGKKLFEAKEKSDMFMRQVLKNMAA